VNHPIVVRLDGNNAAEGRRILEEAGLAVVEQVATMDDAARRAAQLAATGPSGTGPSVNGHGANGHGGDAPATGA
jgi:succinyl-CoA synthetase beta subunit